jgi:farnesyl-diphosphate farnesyltransferase
VNDQRSVLREILKKVSRSFYLSLIILPSETRQQVSLSYLFCRAADTIADTDLLPASSRLTYLASLQDQFRSSPSFPVIGEIRQGLVPLQAQTAERTLLERLEDCFQAYLKFPRADQELIQWLVLTLTRSMEMDLSYFPAETSVPRPFPTLSELDLYCYYVAGCVGEFWTKIHLRHLASLRGWDEKKMCERGVRFGKGLQMTNILRDLSRDLRRGRCYIPETMLKEEGLSASDLLSPQSLPRLRPLLFSLIRQTLEHLDCAWEYTTAIPRREVRLRFACLLPILFSLKTLRLISSSDRLLDQTASVKISRFDVYKTIGVALCLFWSDALLTRLFKRLRNSVSTGPQSER